MDKRLEKYYNGRTCGINLDQGSAVSALSSLIEGKTYDGDLFKMHDDAFMKEQLFPEDYEFWQEKKRDALA